MKVDNASIYARPQRGLLAADIVYEVLIEGAKTRFVAVFHSNIPDSIGPVRSARSTDVDLIADLGQPFLASSGANPVVVSELRAAQQAGTLQDISGLRVGHAYTRDETRRRPYNYFFHYSELDSDAPTSVSPLFAYGGDNPPGLPDAAGVNVTFHTRTNAIVSHIWDPSLAGWARIQGGDIHTLEASSGGVVEAAPANVVVIFTRYVTSSADPESPQAESYGSGDALILTAGAVHEGFWERSPDQPGFRLTDESGTPLSLTPGSTWVLVGNTNRWHPVTSVEVLQESDATALLAEARAAAEPDATDSASP